ncbi:MAG: response regulator [Pseudomonadota bacterium]|nr:response regulator [Pseudomonadota bacterium]
MSATRPAAAVREPPPLQQVVRARREYNRWVAAETLEDYALRFTPRRARRFSELQVGNTAFGAASFLVLEAVGADMLLHAGFQSAFWAILLTGVLIFLIGLPICVHAARHGVDMDLLTRGAGFGYVGSTVTSLIYAAFTFLLFALEAAIMAYALRLSLGIPPWLGYIVCALVVIPLVTHGVSAITRLQALTQPVWLLLLVLPYASLCWRDPGLLQRAWHQAPQPGLPVGFDLAHMGAAMTVGIALITQIAEQVDYLRFMPERTPANRRRWWAGVLIGGPGWVLLGVCKMWGGALLAWLALRSGLDAMAAGDPNRLYLIAFRQVVDDPRAAVWLTAVFVLISQIKINVTNAYAGSLAWSNFFARMTHSHPGRVVWVCFNVLIALLLMEMDVFQALGQVLGLYSSVAIAWMAAVVADLVISKPLGLSPPGIEFRRAALYDINPVGTGAMALGTLLALAAFAGVFGHAMVDFAPVVALVVAFVTAPLLAWATGGRWYLARRVDLTPDADGAACCVVCEQRYEAEDMAPCPAFDGPICSLCCSLDARCQDLCKPHGRLGAQWQLLAARLFPARWQPVLQGGLAEFLLLFLLGAGVLGTLLALVGAQQARLVQALPALRQALGTSLVHLYGCLLVVTAVLCWWLVLTRKSRHAAQDESNRQTARLMQEIASHQRTDQALQKAMQQADAANRAKSRYIVAVSHELRTPLNSLLGYAQLLGDDPSIPSHRRRAVAVIREAGDHLLSVIDHTLDIARIESGRLSLHPQPLDFPLLIQGLVHLFEMQAVDKGIDFDFRCDGGMPALVKVDAQRLRQILINILGNALKFTQQGRVSFHLRYERQMVHFTIRDTGPGIAPADQLRIFEPFQQGGGDERGPTSGTGVGLTIARMLTDLMGGRLQLESEPGAGSCFRLQLYLPELPAMRLEYPPPPARVIGYRGRRRRILIVDDQPNDRELLSGMLRPLGFLLASAGSAAAALALMEGFRPDLVLMDLEMPGMSGWEAIRALRAGPWSETPVAVLSAHGADSEAIPDGEMAVADHLVKPLRLDDFVRWLGVRLALDWVPEPAGSLPPAPAHAGPSAAAARDAGTTAPPPELCSQLRAFVREGYLRGIERELDQLAQRDPAWRPWTDQLRAMAAGFQFERLERALSRAGETS